MVNRFLEVAKERKALRADIDALGRRIQVLKRAPADEATKEEIQRLMRERGGLQGLLRKLNGRETFNFLGRAAAPDRRGRHRSLGREGSRIL